MFKKLRERIAKLRQRFGVEDGAIVALIFGTLSQALGVDVAPAEVDVLMSAGATLVVLLQRWRAAHGR